MIPISEIQDRLKQQVANLHRIEGAAEMQALMQGQARLSGRPIAHVLMANIRAQEPMDAAGAHSQVLAAGFTVALTIPAVADPTGARAVRDAGPLIEAILFALAGWEPTAQMVFGPCSFSACRLLRLDAEMAVWALEFNLPMLLRS